MPWDTGAYDTYTLIPDLLGFVSLCSLIGINSIVGPGLIQPGRAQTFWISYGNRGNVDAIGVPLWIAGIPTGAILSLSFDITEPPTLVGESPTDFSQVPIQFDTGQEIVLPLFISRIPAGSSNALPIQVTIQTQQDFQIRAWTNPPYFGSPFNEDVADCLICLITVLAQFVPGTDCIQATKQYIIDQHVVTAELGQHGPGQKVVSP